jgi:hypothetical protein
MVILAWVVDVSEIIGINSVLEDQRLLHLVRNVILVIWWWWLETCWTSWVNLGIVSNVVKILKSIVVMLQVIIIDLVLPVQWMLHLMRNIVLIIWRWWLKTRWGLWADLNEILLAFLLSSWLSVIILLSNIVSDIILILVWVIHVSQIVLISLVLWNQRFSHLGSAIILLVYWSWYSVLKWLLDVTVLLNLF